jgi:hypothetical protein
VKRLGFQIALLRHAAPAVQRALGPPLARLADLLGKLHDLSALRATVASVSQTAGHDPDRDLLLTLAGERCDRLRKETRALGGELLDERPGAVARRVEAGWSDWRAAKPHRRR